MQVTVLSESDQHIHYRVNHQGDIYFITTCYGANDIAGREKLWNSIKQSTMSTNHRGLL